MVLETPAYLDTNLRADPQFAEPETESSPVMFDERGKFAPGHPGIGGRPKRGATLPERLRAETERRADKIISGVLTKAEAGNVRAFVAVMDRVYGVPKQSLVIERDDDPAAQLLMRMLAAKGLAGLPGSELPALPGPSTDTT